MGNLPMYAALSVTMYLLWLTRVKGMILLASWGTINARWRTRGDNTYHVILTVMDRQTGRQTDCFNSSPETASRAHVSQALQELEHVRGGVFPVAAHHSYAHSTAIGC